VIIDSRKLALMKIAPPYESEEHPSNVSPLIVRHSPVVYVRREQSQREKTVRRKIIDEFTPLNIPSVHKILGDFDNEFAQIRKEKSAWTIC
jgi:hypothetical protein